MQSSKRDEYYVEVFVCVCKFKIKACFALSLSLSLYVTLCISLMCGSVASYLNFVHGTKGVVSYIHICYTDTLLRTSPFLPAARRRRSPFEFLTKTSKSKRNVYDGLFARVPFTQTRAACIHTLAKQELLLFIEVERRKLGGINFNRFVNGAWYFIVVHIGGKNGAPSSVCWKMEWNICVGAADRVMSDII